MFLTVPGNRDRFANFLATIGDELPGRPPDVKEIKEIPDLQAPRVVLHMLSCGKTVFADQRLMDNPRMLDYLTSEMLDRLYSVETGRAA